MMEGKMKISKFGKFMTSELIIIGSEETMAEVTRRLKSIKLTDDQIKAVINGERQKIDTQYFKSDQRPMAKREFFSPYSCSAVDPCDLSLSQLVAATAEAQNKMPTLGSSDSIYAMIVMDYSGPPVRVGISELTRRLEGLGIPENAIKKFIFAEAKVWAIHRNSDNAFDAWGNPEKHLADK